MSTFDGRGSALDNTLVGGPVKKAEPKSTNPTVLRVKQFVRDMRKEADRDARTIRECLIEARVPEDHIGQANEDINAAAREVETYDAITKKLDEVEKELP